MPLIIGGDHTVALGSIRAISSKLGKRNFSVVHFDAHADNYKEYMGSKYSHACVMARARELCDKCYSIGVRSLDEATAKSVKEQIMYRKDMRDVTIKAIA